MNKNNVEITVLVNGNRVNEYNHEGRTFVLAKNGSEYSVRIKNNGCNRVLAVMSVDGLDVISGKPAKLDKSGGYILGAYSSYEIKGFRKDSDTVGAFKFTKRQKGYAASKGDATNSGIISIAIFDEKIQPATYGSSLILRQSSVLNPYSTGPYSAGPYSTGPYGWYGYSGSISASTGMSANCSTVSASNNMTFVNSSNCSSHSFQAPNRNEGVRARSLSLSCEAAEPFAAATSWGSKKDDSVVYGSFEKNGCIPTLFEFFYDFREGLESLGVELEPKKKVAFPNGFDNQFAQPPAGWNGR